MVRVFVSYHHANDQPYADVLRSLARTHKLFDDASVDTGDVSDELSDDAIRVRIRDGHLNNSTVTIVLVGTETRRRKHVDWEIYSSMFNGPVNKQSGVLAIHLPNVEAGWYSAGHGDVEKKALYPSTTNWETWSRSEHEERFPYLPDRIIDNLVKNTARLSVSNWSLLTSDLARFRTLIQLTHDERHLADYDLSRPMRRSNS